MKRIAPFLFVCILSGILPVFIAAQTGSDSSNKSLFEKNDVLELTITGDIRNLLADRGEQSPMHECTLIYKDDDGKSDTINAKIKTRGHFRKLAENCAYPPLQININHPLLQSATFKSMEKLKLVVPCKSDGYVVREWLVYKLYNILTPLSLKARLVKLVLADSKKGKPTQPMYAMLLENEKDMAARNHKLVSEEKVPLSKLDRDPYLRMAMFQYLIGNTDWSVEYLQNIILLKNKDEYRPTTVAYDFDHSGLVNAPYALPEEDLHLSSVTERLYRGYCIQNIDAYDPFIKEFIALKDTVYALYSNCPFTDNNYKKFANKFFDEFYKTISDPIQFAKEFLYPCDKNGSGNVIIKGLKKQ